MLLTRLHKMAWLNATLRLLVVVSLLLPRVAWGECRCASACQTEAACEPEAQPSGPPGREPSPTGGKTKAATRAKKGCCCCCEPGSPCCCCQAEQDGNADPSAPATHDDEKGSNPKSSTPAPPDASDSSPSQPSKTPPQPRQPGPRNPHSPEAPCAVAPDDCGCCQVQVRWTNPVPLVSKLVECAAPAGTLEGAAGLLVPATIGSEGLALCPVSCANSQLLLPLLCRWQI
jgi:hypothetical protein